MPIRDAPASPIVKNMIMALGGAGQHLFNLPQRFMEASEGLRRTGEYNAAPGAELMQLLATGGMGGAEAGAAGALGGKLKLTPGVKTPVLSRNPNGLLHNIMDEEGNMVGRLKTSQPEPGHVHIENVYSTLPRTGTMEEQNPYNWGAGQFGHGATRSLIKALRNEYPDMEKLSGFRVSGARDKWNNIGRVEMRIPKAPPGTEAAGTPSFKLPNVPLTIQRGTPIESSTGQTLTPISGANFARRTTMGQVFPEQANLLESAQHMTPNEFAASMGGPRAVEQQFPEMYTRMRPHLTPEAFPIRPSVTEQTPYGPMQTRPQAPPQPTQADLDQLSTLQQWLARNPSAQ